MKTEVIILGLLLISVLFGLIFYQEFESKELRPEFQGPVPLDYDLDHYRKTGETRRLNG